MCIALQPNAETFQHFAIFQSVAMATDFMENSFFVAESL